MFSATLVLASLASCTLAAPLTSYSTRATSSWCAGLGPGAFDTASNFTLAALNTSSSNVNATGAPLVLGQNGAVDGAEFQVLSTYATYPYNDFPSLSLVKGALIPNAADGTPSTDVNITTGSMLSFITSPSDTQAPAQIYCAIASIDPEYNTPYPALSVNDDPDGFELCMNGDGPYAQNNVVWRPTQDNNGAYLYDTCYPVKVQLLGLDT